MCRRFGVDAREGEAAVIAPPSKSQITSSTCTDTNAIKLMATINVAGTLLICHLAFKVYRIHLTYIAPTARRSSTAFGEHVGRNDPAVNCGIASPSLRHAIVHTQLSVARCLASPNLHEARPVTQLHDIVQPDSIHAILRFLLVSLRIPLGRWTTRSCVASRRSIHEAQAIQ